MNSFRAAYVHFELALIDAGRPGDSAHRQVPRAGRRGRLNQQSGDRPRAQITWEQTPPRQTVALRSRRLRSHSLSWVQHRWPVILVGDRL